MACCGPKPDKDVEIFHPDFREEPITEKFYSRYERMPEGTTPTIQKYEKELDRRRQYDARCSYKLPRYSNQMYGWLPGYKIRFLQSCDLNIYKSKAIMAAIYETYTKHINEPLAKYHDCSCRKYLRDKECRYLKRPQEW